ncbi:unnamed protein product [Ectocarpus fasciculatus]
MLCKHGHRPARKNKVLRVTAESGPRGFYHGFPPFPLSLFFLGGSGGVFERTSFQGVTDCLGCITLYLEGQQGGISSTVHGLQLAPTLENLGFRKVASKLQH